MDLHKVLSYTGESLCRQIENIKNWRAPLIAHSLVAHIGIIIRVLITLKYLGYFGFLNLMIFLSRMTPYANEIIGEYQCGFRRNRSTVDQIFSIRQILEKKWEYNKNACQLYLDFDSIKI